MSTRERIAEARGLLLDVFARGSHIHSATDGNIDRCRTCGHDIRHPIHSGNPGEALDKLLLTLIGEGEPVGYVVLLPDPAPAGKRLTSATREIVQGTVWPYRKDAETYAMLCGQTMPALTVHPVGQSILPTPTESAPTDTEEATDE